MKKKLLMVGKPGTGKTSSFKVMEDFNLLKETPDHELPLLLGRMKSTIGKNLLEQQIRKATERVNYPAHKGRGLNLPRRDIAYRDIGRFVRAID